MQVDEHTYRAVLVVGVQPGTAHTLFDGVDAGLPQRFLWWPVSNPDMPERRGERPETPVWSTPKPPSIPTRRQTGRRAIDFCQQAASEVDAVFCQRQRDGYSADPLTSHDMQNRCKIASALALLFGGTEVTEEIWRLSAPVLKVSTDTRAAVIASLHESAADRNRQRGRADGERTLAAETVIAEDRKRRVQRVADRCHKILADRGSWPGRSYGAAWRLKSGHTSKTRLTYSLTADGS